MPWAFLVRISSDHKIKADGLGTHARKQKPDIKEGDILLAIDGVSVAHQHPRCLLEKLLWGRQGSDVQLSLQAS
jgi:C-terminal processing protease CtpA/Prc